MPLYGEDAWDHARWGIMGGELPVSDWFQIAYDSDETDILSIIEFSSALYAGSSTGGKIFKSTDGTTCTNYCVCSSMIQINAECFKCKNISIWTIIC